jgi:hypothetical protein
VKKKSGKRIDGISSEGFVKTLWSVRQATPWATATVLMSGPS